VLHLFNHLRGSASATNDNDYYGEPAPAERMIEDAMSVGSFVFWVLIIVWCCSPAVRRNQVQTEPQINDANGGTLTTPLNPYEQSQAVTSATPSSP